MKKIFVIVLLVSCLAAFGQGKKNVSIKGRIIHNVEAEIYLSKLGEKTLIKLDSSVINKDGEFTIKTEINSTGFYQLGFGKEDYMILVIEPGEKIKLEINSVDLSTPRMIEGSPGSQLVYHSNNIISFFDVKIDSLNKVYQKFYYTNKRDSVGAVLLEQYTDLETKQKNYVRKMIQDNYGSLACLIFIDRLKIEEDFEIYKNLANTLFEKYPENILSRLRESKLVYLLQLHQPMHLLFYLVKHHKYQNPFLYIDYKS